MRLSGSWPSGSNQFLAGACAVLVSPDMTDLDLLLPAERILPPPVRSRACGRHRGARRRFSALRLLLIADVVLFVACMVAGALH